MRDAAIRGCTLIGRDAAPRERSWPNPICLPSQDRPRAVGWERDDCCYRV